MANIYIYICIYTYIYFEPTYVSEPVYISSGWNDYFVQPVRCSQPLMHCYHFQEDRMVVELVYKYGAKRWSVIASHLKGRIGKQCRER